MGIKIVGISCCTNMATGICEGKLCHEDVISTANMTKDGFKKLLRSFIPEL